MERGPVLRVLMLVVTGVVLLGLGVGIGLWSRQDAPPTTSPVSPSADLAPSPPPTPTASDTAGTSPSGSATSDNSSEPAAPTPTDPPTVDPTQTHDAEPQETAEAAPPIWQDAPAPPQQTAPTPWPECPTGHVDIVDLRIEIIEDRVLATGYLVNNSNGEIYASEDSTPMVYGLNSAGKWVTIIHDGSLTPAWDTGTVSPSDFVLEPGARASFSVEESTYRVSDVSHWYPVPTHLFWNEYNFSEVCPVPQSDYQSPASAG